MSGASDPLAWVIKAEEYYTVARAALRRRTPFTSTACFHAQQCAEKYLKALLVSRASKFSKVHDLLKLSQECEKAGIVVTTDSTLLDKLSFHAIETRYPVFTPTLADAREAIATSRSVRRFARKLLGFKP